MTSSDAARRKTLANTPAPFLAAPGGNRQISMRGAQELGE
jgi:hypothetical protein